MGEGINWINMYIGKLSMPSFVARHLKKFRKYKIIHFSENVVVTAVRVCMNSE